MTEEAVIGLLLAGGRATRMGGGDKCLRLLAGRPLLDHVIERLGPQVSLLLLNANGDPARFSAFGLPVAADSPADFAGPLAGILAGLDWAAAERPEVIDVLSVPGDCPFLPDDLAARLAAARTQAGVPIACARSGDWRHPVVALWPVALREDLRHALVVEDLHKIEIWTARHGVVTVDWPTVPVDPFFNVNTPEDVTAAQRMAAEAGL